MSLWVHEDWAWTHELINSRVHKFMSSVLCTKNAPLTGESIPVWFVGNLVSCRLPILWVQWVNESEFMSLSLSLSLWVWVWVWVKYILLCNSFVLSCIESIFSMEVLWDDRHEAVLWDDRRRDFVISIICLKRQAFILYLYGGPKGTLSSRVHEFTSSRVHEFTSSWGPGRNSWVHEFMSSRGNGFTSSWVHKFMCSRRVYDEFTSSEFMSLWVHVFMSSCVHEFMSSWVHEFMSSWVHEFMSSWVHEFMSSWVDEFMSWWVHEFMSSWVHEFMSSWVHEFMSLWVHEDWAWTHELINSRVHEFMSSVLCSKNAPLTGESIPVWFVGNLVSCRLLILWVQWVYESNESMSLSLWVWVWVWVKYILLCNSFVLSRIESIFSMEVLWDDRHEPHTSLLW